MSILQEYSLEPQIPAPADYPFSQQPDEFSTEPFAAEYPARREAFLRFVSANPSPSGPSAPWYELVRLSTGAPVHLGIIQAALEYIDQRLDCSDFVIHALLRLLYQFQEPAKHSNIDIQAVKRTVLNFKYWPDEPGNDSMCTWTENHYILFASAAYLAGQLFPDETFANSGRTGSELMSLHRQRILRWLELRFYTGFSEWLSNVYYDEDLVALLNLVEFNSDEDMQERATILVDLILLDIATNSFQGIFGSTHGRSYEDSKKWADQENTSATTKLLFGCGRFCMSENMSACALALSNKYQLPRVLFQISNDNQRPEMLNRQRMSFDVAECRWWGINPRKQEDALHLLTMEAYFHPKFAGRFIRLLKTFNWWENDFFAPVAKRRGLVNLLSLTGLLPLAMRYFEKDLTRNTREAVNIYTYRTPDYMLSAAQDYKPGFGGDQQHLWQATLGPGAICFTTQPARTSGPPPNYWCGNGSNPRIAQFKNVIFAIYKAKPYPSLYLPSQVTDSHAWLPRDQFEEFHEQDGWLFARWGDGYLALLSQYPYEWQEHPGENQGREIIVRRPNNTWLCELGDKPNYGDFQAFIERILQAPVRFFGDHHFQYHSPSQGLLSFGWTQPLRHEGRKVELGNYPRYGSPYVQAAFPSDRLEIACENETLQIDWPNRIRTTNAFV